MGLSLLLFASHSQLYLLLSPIFSSHVKTSVGSSIYECLQRGGRQAAAVTAFPDGICELISPSHSSQICFVTESNFSLKS